MSQIEQRFREYLSRHPEIRVASELINTRAVARSFIKEEHLSFSQIEAVVAMIRRAEIKPIKNLISKDIYKNIVISIKDEITILDYEKQIVEKLRDIIHIINYERGETLKLSVGTQS